MKALQCVRNQHFDFVLLASLILLFKQTKEHFMQLDYKILFHSFFVVNEHSFFKKSVICFGLSFRAPLVPGS